MHSIKEDTVQTYPIRNSKKHKQYVFPIVLLAINALLISAVCILAIPDPMGNTIQQHMKENNKPR